MSPLVAAPLLIALASAGCTMARTTGASLSPALQESVLSAAAMQVRRCYRAPRVSTEARQIATRLRLRLSSGGILEGLPTVIAQDGVTAANEAYAPRMAEAAVGAVLRCAPLRLPEEAYREGRLEIELTFSQAASV